MLRAFCLVVLLPLSAVAADWPQWRGPNRDGVVATPKLPAHWPETLTQLWQVTVGEGHSSPLIVGKRVYIHTRADDVEVVRCLDLADGKEIWKQTNPAPYEMNSAATAHGKGPKSTPALAEGKLVTFGISGILSAFDASSGKLLWRKDFSRTFRNTSPLYGTALSPLIDGNRVLVHVGGHDAGALSAFSLDKGQTLWTASKDGPGYSSPVLVTLAGQKQYVLQTQRALVGVSPAGRLLWQLPYTTEYDQNIVTPVIFNDLVIHSGYNRPLQAIRVTGKGTWNLRSVWENEELPMYMSSPVLSGKYLYGMTQRNAGQLFCIEASTGKVAWKSPGRQGENVALVKAGEVFLALNNEGRLTVFRDSSTKFDPVKTYRVADTPTWAHPVVSGNVLLIKDLEKLTAYRLAEE
jgi:outer membrane protein assembly factor BamB